MYFTEDRANYYWLNHSATMHYIRRETHLFRGEQLLKYLSRVLSLPLDWTTTLPESPSFCHFSYLVLVQIIQSCQLQWRQYLERKRWCHFTVDNLGYRKNNLPTFWQIAVVILVMTSTPVCWVDYNLLSCNATTFQRTCLQAYMFVFFPECKARKKWAVFFCFLRQVTTCMAPWWTDVTILETCQQTYEQMSEIM